MSEERGKGAAILATLRSRISEGEYRPGYNLPAQRTLAEEFDVSRDTIQRVLAELKTEGWIESRQGSGSTVRVTLPHHVTTQPKMPHGRSAPDTAALRRDRAAVSAGQGAEGCLRSRSAGTGPDPSGGHQEVPHGQPRTPPSGAGQGHRRLDCPVEIRRVPLVPYSKLYVFNGAEVVTGPYVPSERPITLDDGTTMDVVDVMGFDSTLTHCVKDADPDSQDSLIVSSWQRWFDSTWRLPAT